MPAAENMNRTQIGAQASSPVVCPSALEKAPLWVGWGHTSQLSRDSVPVRACNGMPFRLLKLCFQSYNGSLVTWTAGDKDCNCVLAPVTLSGITAGTDGMEEVEEEGDD